MVSPKDSSNQPTPKSGYSPGSPSGSTDPNPSSPSLYSPSEATHHNSQAENDPRVQQKSDISVANYDRPPKMVEQSKKSRWWLAPAGFVVAVAVGFAGAQFRDVLVEDSTPLAATDTVTLTTQVVSTTIEPTTTLAPTTTVAETTTTLPNYEREELGLLKEGPEGRLVSTYQALLSGIVLAVENEQVTAQVEGAVTVREEWVLYVDLGNRPQSGETIVGRLILGNLPSGALPYCKPSAGGTSCNAVFEEEVGSLLKAGWRYEFFIRMVPETNCEDLPEEQNTAENQDLCLQWRNDLTSLWVYNGELVDALKGAELPDPDRIGSVGSVEIPLGSP